MKKLNKLVPDTSAVINQIISTSLKKKEFAVKEVLIHIALMSELENQANQGKEIGFLGLAEIKRFKELEESKKLKLTFSGERPTIEEIKFCQARLN